MATKLILPSDAAEPESYDIRSAFKMLAKKNLAGMDVTSMTPEVKAKLDEAYAQVQTLLGKDPASAIKDDMMEDALEDAQWEAKRAQPKSATDELNDCSPCSIMD